MIKFLILSSCTLLYSQDLAEHLVIHGHCLSATDHKELRSLFNLGQQSSRWAMDRRVALAMANLDIPRSWNVLGSHSGDGERGGLSYPAEQHSCTDVLLKIILCLDFII